MLRLHLDEVDVDPVDRRDEVRQGVQPRLALAPVVLAPPVARELLHRRERHALRLIRHDLLVRPPRRRYAAFEVGELLVREVDAEGADSVGGAPSLRLSLRGGCPADRNLGPALHRCLSHGDRSSYEKCDSCPRELHGFPPFSRFERSAERSKRNTASVPRALAATGTTRTLSLVSDRHHRPMETAFTYVLQTTRPMHVTSKTSIARESVRMKTM